MKQSSHSVAYQSVFSLFSFVVDFRYVADYDALVPYVAHEHFYSEIDMNKSVINFFASLVIGGLLSACAELKEAGQSIGNTTKNVTTDIGHGSRDTAQAIGRGTKRVVKAVTEEPAQPSQ